MVLKKKMAVMCATSAITVMALVGCSSTGGGDTSGGGNKTGKGEAKALDVLANENARAAIAMSVDRQAMCDTILNNEQYLYHIM